jgi:hypothetical protein
MLTSGYTFGSTVVSYGVDGLTYKKWNNKVQCKNYQIPGWRTSNYDQDLAYGRWWDIAKLANWHIPQETVPADLHCWG